MTTNTPRPLPRRSFLSLLGAAGGAGLLTAAGCGGGGGNGGGGGGGPLDIWVLQDPVQNEVQNGAIDRFTESTGTDAKITPYANDAYRDKLQVAMGSPNQPDVFFNWGGGSIRPYVESDLLVDLTPTLEEDQEFKNRFLPSVLDAGRIGDQYYGIPNRGMQPKILFYNQAAFDEIGADPPQTYQDLLDLADRFNSAGITPCALAGAQSWCELIWFEYLTDRIGGAGVFQRIAAGEQGAWQQPAVTRALEEIQRLVEIGFFASNFSSVDYGDGAATRVFAEGAGMHLMGSWEYTNCLDQHPDFAGSDLRFVNFPQVEDGSGDPRAIVGNPTNYFSVTQASDNVDGAIEFLREMASEEYVAHYTRNGDVMAIAGIEDLLQSEHPDPEFASFVYGMVQDAPSFTLSWDQAINRQHADPMVDNLQKVFLGDLDPAGYVEAMENL